jgi:dTDP-4-amino-4,6-dideoxygalactose transaminase
MPDQRAQRQVPFVEDKRPDLANVARHLASSAADNHWTNFGPVWSALKTRIERMLTLPANRTAIPCASGTHALMASAALAERQGPRRWLSPAYAFRATATGPFANARIIDCNRHGSFDADLLARADPASYDAVVMLDPFGLLSDLGTVVSFTHQRGMPLVVDNAMGFFGLDRSDHGGVFECISLHHTKPFGFGEGGCLIVDRELEEDARRALNFGYGWPWPGGTSSLSNGKMSEPAAAFILDRLERAPKIMPDYRRQFARILAIAEDHGFRLLVDRRGIGEAVPGNVPLLSPKPLPRAIADNDLVAVAKYYPPIHGLPVASDLYARVVNVPCHPGVAALSDGQISLLFSRWADG